MSVALSDNLVSDNALGSSDLLAEPAGTKIVWEQEFADAKVAAAVRHIVEPSNEQNLDRLLMCLRGEV